MPLTYKRISTNLVINPVEILLAAAMNNKLRNKLRSANRELQKIYKEGFQSFLSTRKIQKQKNWWQQIRACNSANY